MNPPLLVWLPIIGIVAARFVLGMLWYSPLMWMKPWIGAMRRDKNDQRWEESLQKPESAKVMYIGIATSVFFSLFQTTVLAHTLHWAGASTLCDACKVGAWLYVAFSFPAGISDHVWSDRPFMLCFITQLHHFVGMMISAVGLVYFHAFSAANPANALSKFATAPEIWWSGVLLCMLAHWFVGMLWFGPLFGESWKNSLLHDKNDPKWAEAIHQKNGLIMVAMGSGLSLSIVKAIVMATFMSWIGVSTSTDAVVFSAWMFAGLVLPGVLSDHVWADRPVSLMVITFAHHAVDVFASALILLHTPGYAVAAAASAAK